MNIRTHLVDGTVVTANRTKGDWTKERIALLRKLWKTAAPSSEIAKAICKLPGAPITKNACCGKAHRLGLGVKPNAASDPLTSEWRSDKSRRGHQTRLANGTEPFWRRKTRVGLDVT